MNPTIRIGTGAVAYKEWKGRFYPKDVPASQALAFYSRTFSALEVNNTFYRMPTASEVKTRRTGSQRRRRKEHAVGRDRRLGIFAAATPALHRWGTARMGENDRPRKMEAGLCDLQARGESHRARPGQTVC